MRFSAKQKSRLLSNPLGSAWSDGGLHSAGGLTERVSDYHWYLSAHRAPDLPCSTASSMESITVAYLSWKSMLKRKELLLADSTIETGIEKTAGRKKGNLASGCGLGHSQFVCSTAASTVRAPSCCRAG